MDSKSFFSCPRNTRKSRLVTLLSVVLLLTVLLCTATSGEDEEPPCYPRDPYQLFLETRQNPFQLVWLSVTGQAASPDPSLVLVMVNATLYPHIATRVNTYVSDIQKEGYEVKLCTVSGGTAETLKAAIQGQYDNGRLKGCVLIGAMPYALYETSDYGAFPCDMFLCDFDAEWKDENPYSGALPLVYDGYAVGLHEGPEIFVGRIDASNMNPMDIDPANPCTEQAKRTNDYLDKTHTWHNGTMPRTRRSLFVAACVNRQDNPYPDGDTIVCGTETRNDFRERLKRDPATDPYAYELVEIEGHGWPEGGQVGDHGGFYYAADVRDWPARPQFYCPSHCQISLYTYINDCSQTSTFYGCVGNYYIFNSSQTSLVTIGNTRTNAKSDIIAGMLAGFGEHQSVGEAYRRGFEKLAPYTDGTLYDFGYVILGDPLAMPFPPPIHVKPDGDDSLCGYSWASAKRTINGAIASLPANVPDGEIWVAAGTYNEQINFPKSVRLYGGFAGTEESPKQRDWRRNTTTIDWRAGDTITVSNMQGCRLDGFTIRSAGRGVVVSSCEIAVENNTIVQCVGEFGGGICANSSSVAIDGNTITGCSSDIAGAIYLNQCSGTVSANAISQNACNVGPVGGVYCLASDMAFSGNTFTGNSGDMAGAIMCSGSPAPTITGDTFTGNSSDYRGAAIHCDGSSATISGCWIAGNAGIYTSAGISCSACSPMISGNVISNNIGYCGTGIFCEQAPAYIVNNFITGNDSLFGGGIYCGAGSNATIVNNTIAGNTADDSGAGIFAQGSALTIKNNIIAFNTQGICINGFPMPVLSHNNAYSNGAYDYWGVTPDPDSISADPLFAKPAIGNYHLQPGSACIDAGTSDGAPSVDIDGNQRAFDGNGDGAGACDIGADEFGRIHVKLGSPGPIFDGLTWATAYHTIQQGIDVAGSHEVWVAAGTYNEAVSMRDGVKLYGGFGGDESIMEFRDPVAHTTLITGGGSEHAVAFSSIADPLTRIDGFTITNQAPDGVGVYAIASGGTIENNIISGNNGGGVHCYEADGCALLTIARNTIAGNHSERYGGGVLINSSENCSTEYSNAAVIGNIIRGNSALYGGGICSYECNGGVAISSNTIVDNTATGSGGGVYMYVSCPTVENNIIAHNSVYGISYYYGGCNPLTLPLRNNDVYGNSPSGYYGLEAGPTDISVDPLLVDRPNGDLHLTSASPCINAGCNDARGQLALDIDGQARIAGTVDIGADECAILHVSTTGSDTNDGYSWAQAKRTIQAAVNAAGSRGEVWVKAGIYAEKVDMRSGIRLYGGFAGNETKRSQRNWTSNVTTIDGGANDATIAMAQLADPFTTVDGFTIRHSAGTNAKGIYCEASSGVIANDIITANNGGGIYCTDDSVITVTGNTITGNGGNGGITAWNSIITVTGNTIEYNDSSSSVCGGGGILTACTDAVISNNTIRWNSSGCGGGIHCMIGEPVITNNTLTGNDAPSAGGIYISNVYGGEVSGNTITGNTSDKGGGVYVCISWIDIKNNIVSANSGGGIYLEDTANFPITNNTIVDNTGYGGIYSEAHGAPIYKNNIIAYNTWGIYNGLFGDCRANPILSNNDVFGNTAGNYAYVSPGAGDISANPFLVKRNQGDFHLRAKSPCVDTGTNTGAPSVDRDGRARPIDGDGNGTATCDIGALERPMDLTGILKNYANGSHVDLWSVAVTACLTGADPSGQNWMYVENTDRTAGIRVKTTKTFSLNQLVRVSGTIQTDTSTGERYIAADTDYPKADGGTFAIAPIGMRNAWIGGHASGYEPPIRNGFGFYNIGMLVQTWGRVTYVNTAGRYFYITDGSVLNDGSGHGGLRVSVPSGVSLPTVSVFVKVKGISGASVIGTNYVRTLRVRMQSDITGVFSWLNSDIPLSTGCWNALAIPGIPAYSDSANVLVGSPYGPGIQLGGFLKCYDAPTQQWIIEGEGCGSVGGIMLAEGYMLYIPPNGATSYVYDRTPADGDQFLSLPVGSETPENCSLIGNPFDTSVTWASCLATDGSWTGTLPEAVEAGYIHKVCYWNGSTWNDVTNLSTGSMASRTAYLIYPRYNDLAVIVPAQ